MQEKRGDQPHNKKQTKVGYVLGGTSFIPLFGVLFGILAIVVGLSKRQRTPIILGTLGISFSVLIYGLLFYFGFVAKTGPFVEIKKQLVATELNQDQGQLALYYQRYGHFPQRLSEIPNASTSPFYQMDPWGHTFVYSTTPDGSKYHLTSIGADGIANTADDITVESIKL